jgi:predicted ArsR family transcriptional regulator
MEKEPLTLSGRRTGVDAQVRSIASLGEPVRRKLYRYVTGHSEPVSREQAAAGVEVALHVAKFHLDRLEQDGLLEVEYRRQPGRTGPGAGRPTKFYRRVDRDIAVSLPGRRYDLAARVLAEAITAAEDEGVELTVALRGAARAAGQKLGEDAAVSAGERLSVTEVVAAVCDVLDEIGYEPDLADTGITLGNCPFHSLAADYTELVCGMNLDLINGMLGCLEEGVLAARLDPAPGRCCVTLRRSNIS